MDLKKILPPALIAILPSFLTLIVLAILLIAAAPTVLSKLSSQRAELAGSVKDENVVNSKISLLREIEPQSLTQTNLAVIAVPQKNPALIVLSQLKNLAALNSVTLDNLKVSTAVKEENLSKIEIGFDVDGVFSGVVTFVRALGGMAPLIRIEKVKISQAAGAARAETSITAYWAAYPEKLPPILEPAQGLSNDEKDLIARFARLTPPTFLEVAPQSPSVRVNPFD